MQRLDEDHKVDWASGKPGQMLFEKMVSGLFMGEVARLVIIAVSQPPPLTPACLSVPPAGTKSKHAPLLLLLSHFPSQHLSWQQRPALHPCCY